MTLSLKTLNRLKQIANPRIVQEIEMANRINHRRDEDKKFIKSKHHRVIARRRIENETKYPELLEDLEDLALCETSEIEDFDLSTVHTKL